jgi:hypothetical protein
LRIDGSDVAVSLLLLGTVDEAVAAGEGAQVRQRLFPDPCLRRVQNYAE